jgi:hypothetical protein
MKIILKYLILALMIIVQNNLSQAQINYNYEYDGAGNRILLNSSNDCSMLYCECPPDIDNWLILSSAVGVEPCTDYQCKITNFLNVPEGNECFSYYSVGDGIPSTNIYPIPSGGHLTGIDRCVDFGETVQITVYLYRYLNDPVPCRITKVFQCHCACPPSINDWLTLTSTPGGSDCEDYQCKVQNIINIPSEYPCFTHYKVDDGNGFTTPEEIPASGILNHIDRCIEGDETFTVNVELMQGLDDTKPCPIEKSVYCNYDCCDFIHVNFIGQEVTGNECCFVTSITSVDETLCDPSPTNVSVAFTNTQGTDLDPDGDGIICLDSQGDMIVNYTVTINGVPCTQKSEQLSCEACPCPEDYIKSKWLSLTVDKNAEGCSADMCLVAAELNIDPEYADCFTHFNYSSSVGSDYTHFGSVEEVPADGIIDDIIERANPEDPQCVPSGTVIQMRVKLYRGADDTNPCIITGDAVTCERVNFELRDDACDPDGAGAWTYKKTIPVIVNGCEYNVSFVARKSPPPDDNQDIQIVGFEPVDENCNSVNADEEVFRTALPFAIAEALDDNEEWEPQKDDIPPCTDLWRVVQNSCWSTWTASDMTTQENYEVVLPCDADCCVRQLRVCNYPDSVSVEDLGFVSGDEFDCAAASPKIPPHFGTSVGNLLIGCHSVNCSIYEDIDIIIDIPQEGKDRFNEKIELLQYKPDLNHDDDKFNMKSRSIDIIYQVNHYNSNLELKVLEAELSNVTINIQNVLGQSMDSHTFYLSGGYDQFNIDISDLRAGTYVYNLVSNGKIFGTGKFLVVK